MRLFVIFFRPPQPHTHWTITQMNTFFTQNACRYISVTRSQNKSSQKNSKVAPNWGQRSFYNKMKIFKMASNDLKYFGYFCKKICGQELWKNSNLVTLVSVYTRTRDIKSTGAAILLPELIYFHLRDSIQTKKIGNIFVVNLFVRFIVGKKKEF